MATMNKRMCIDDVGTWRMEETPIPEPEDGEAIVKITHAGICYSDVHMAYTPKFHPKFVFPRVLGHEIAGKVYAFGKKAEEERSDLNIGDDVIVFPWGNCRNCETCRADCSYCLTSGYGKGPVGGYVYGVWRDGGYQQYLRLEVPSFMEKAPSNIPMSQACLLPCSGLTSYNAVAKLEEAIPLGKRVHGKATVGLVGVGGLALWAIQIMKAYYGQDVRLIAIDINKEKVDDAIKQGADYGHVWGKDESAAEAVEKLVADVGGRMDAVLDFIGAESVVERSFLSLTLGGTLVLVGLSGTMMPPMTLNSVLRRNVCIRGTMVGTQSQLRGLLKLVNEGKVKPPPVEEVEIEQIEATHKKLIAAQQRGRAVVKM